MIFIIKFNISFNNLNNTVILYCNVGVIFWFNSENSQILFICVSHSYNPVSRNYLKIGI